MAYHLPPYRDEVRAKIGEELGAQLGVPGELPHQLLVVLMQLQELDRTAARRRVKRDQRRCGVGKLAKAARARALS